MVLTQDDRILAYIDAVCSQIEFREVHQEIKFELATHLQEIVEEYLSNGFSEDVAITKAIAQMGSADTVGKQLNKVHKPKPEWSILVLSLFFVSLGLLAMYFIERQGVFTSVPLFNRSFVFTVFGAIIVVGLYLFDYRRLEPFSKHIYLGTIFFLIILISFGHSFNGKLYLSIGPIYFNFVEISPLLLSVALAGILNSRDWNKPHKLLPGLLLCVAPLILILAGGSLTAGVIYTITCITLAIVSGARLKNILLLMVSVSGVILLPIINNPYQLQRLISFLNPASDPAGSGWLNIQLRQLINSSGLWGQGLAQKPESIPSLHTEFIFSYITFTFGWIAGGVLVALVVMFILRLTGIAKAVKNNYARLLISGFTTIFAVQFLWNICMNLGLAPVSGIGLPFVSFGGSQLIFNAVALGIVSSIYRRRNISRAFINS